MTKPFIFRSLFTILVLVVCRLTVVAQISVACKLGEPEVVLTNGQYGLKYFPDEALVIVRTNPNYSVIMAAGVRSVLLEGKTMETLGMPKDVLLPGKVGEFDNGYAGIGCVWHASSENLLAFYHAEDHEDLPRNAAGIPGFYCRVALAVSHDDGMTFEKKGPILSGHLAKVAGGRFDQGVGEHCLLAEPAGQMLYLYYTSHEPIDGRGVQICLARCPAAEALQPGAWQKFYVGGFTEPGLGGRDTPIVTSGVKQADALCPYVVYVAAWRQFVMVFSVNVWREHALPDQSGFYVGFSDDGIHWPRERMQQIWKIPVIAEIGGPVAWHPALVLDTATRNGIQGWIYYGFSENWGHRPPCKGHYLVRRPITLAWNPQASLGALTNHPHNKPALLP